MFPPTRSRASVTRNEPTSPLCSQSSACQEGGSEECGVRREEGGAPKQVEALLPCHIRIGARPHRTAYTPASPTYQRSGQPTDTSSHNDRVQDRSFVHGAAGGRHRARARRNPAGCDDAPRHHAHPPTRAGDIVADLRVRNDARRRRARCDRNHRFPLFCLQTQRVHFFAEIFRENKSDSTSTSSPLRLGPATKSRSTRT